MEENIDKRKISTNAKHYLEAEKLTRNITRIFYFIIFASVIAFITLPLLMVLVDYLTGNLTANSWHLPFGVVLFYDTVSSPGFEITYFIGIFATFATGGAISLIDTLFFGLTVHVTAIFKDLQDMINDLDKNAINLIEIEHLNNSDDNDCTKHRCEEFRNHYRQKLVKCIDFHEFSLRKMFHLQVVTDGLIFLQYCTSTTMLCLVVFQAAHALNSGIFLKNFLFLITLSSQLFIYTWFGHQLTFEGQQVADTIYQTNWYVHKTNVQKLHYFMISRAQCTKYLMGQKVIRCNLESFSSVLSATASAFALLQSVLQKT